MCFGVFKNWILEQERVITVKYTIIKFFKKQLGINNKNSEISQNINILQYLQKFTRVKNF